MLLHWPRWTCICDTETELNPCIRPQLNASARVQCYSIRIPLMAPNSNGSISNPIESGTIFDHIRPYLMTYRSIPRLTFAAIESALGEIASKAPTTSILSRFHRRADWFSWAKSRLYMYSVIQTTLWIRATYVRPIAKTRQLIKHEQRSNFGRQIAAAYWHIHSTSRTADDHNDARWVCVTTDA